VMGIAAVVLHELARSLRINSAIIPGVGVREGTLRELALEHFNRHRRTKSA